MRQESALKKVVNQYLEYMPSRDDMELKVQGLSELRYIVDSRSNNVADNVRC